MMKNRILGTIIFIGALLLASDNNIFTNVTFEEALALGKEEDRSVVVKFHADWCHFCRKMDNDTFAAVKVRNALEEFILVKVDIEEDDGLILARKYKVTGLPTVMTFDSNGNILYAQAGYQSPEMFLKTLNSLHK